MFDCMITHTGMENLNAAELELVVLSRLELAWLSQQRHHSAMAARIVLSAMKLLQKANIFKVKKQTIPARKYVILLF